MDLRSWRLSDKFPLLPVRCDGESTIMDASLPLESYEAVHSGSNDNVKPSMDTDGGFCSYFEPQAEDVCVAMKQRGRYDEVADIDNSDASDASASGSEPAHGQHR